MDDFLDATVQILMTLSSKSFERLHSLTTQNLELSFVMQVVKFLDHHSLPNFPYSTPTTQNFLLH